MTDKTPPRGSDAKRWLETWRRAAPILEAERHRDLVDLTDEEARHAATLLFELWQPDWPSDDGEGLLLQQRVFARARRE